MKALRILSTRLSDWGIRGASAWLMVLWLLAMISIPIQRWVWGEGAVLRAAIIGVILQALLVLVLMRRVMGLRGTLQTAVGIAVFAWAIEWVGSSTGIPFGRYRYAAQLQPQLAGVPSLIPLAWLMMIPPSWAVAARITRRKPAASRPGLDWRFCLLSALAFTAWDLFLDPQMVRWGLWAWEGPGSYFGIPLTNFAGWVLASALLTALLRPRPVPDVALAIVYCLTWALESVALVFFWGLAGPGIVGFVVMGMFVVLTLLSEGL
jgi:lycopene beta-cyclase